VAEMKVDASAFELQQKFHEPDTVSLYKDSLFVVIRRGTAELQTVRDFARALEPRLTPGR